MSRYRLGHSRVLFQGQTTGVAPAASNFLTALLTLDVAWLGYPYNDGVIQAADVASVQAMDIAFLGMPFVSGVL